MHSPPGPVARSAAAEVESEVEEAGHHEGRHHHPRVGDHQAHVLKLDLATRARLVIPHSVIVINTLNNQENIDSSRSFRLHCKQISPVINCNGC